MNLTRLGNFLISQRQKTAFVYSNLVKVGIELFQEILASYLLK